MLNLIGKKICVWDCEIKRPIESLPQGWKDFGNMGISCLCLFDYFTNRYRVFDDRSQSEAVSIIRDYDVTVGYNIVGFDHKLLNASWSIPNILGSTRHSRDFDILRQLWVALGLNPDIFSPRTHGNCKLDKIADETINMRKSGDGANAPKLFQQGRTAELIDYCLNDVLIEKSLFEFVVNYGYVIRDGVKISINFKL